RKRTRLHVVDNVRQGPLSALPDKREVPASHLWVHSYLRSQTLEWNVSRCCDPARRRLAEYSNPGVVVLVGSRGSPRIVHAVDYDARLSLADQLPRHGRTHEIDARLNCRRHVWFPRLGVRRQEEPRACIALLVDVVDDLRMPDVLDLVDGK